MESISDTIDRVSRGLLLVMASAVTVIVIAAVIARYVFNSSFPWSEELSRGLLTWLVFFGAASAYKNREMVAMESLRDSLSDRTLLIVRLICEAFTVLFLVALIFASYRLISLTSRQTYPVSGYPLWIAYAAMPVSALIMGFHSIVRFMKLRNGSEPLRQEFLVDELA